jgi:hypothetical protein
MWVLLLELGNVFSFPVPHSDCEVRYLVLVGSEKARWDTLVQHGAADLASSGDGFRVSRQLIERQIARFRWQRWSPPPARVAWL